MLFLSGLIVGIILFQSSILAPILFKTLEIEDAGKLLRAVFPKFFILLTLIGIVSLVILLIQETESTFVHYIIVAVSIVFPTICKMIIPATNKARDDGDDTKFQKLHKISVILTVTVLFANIGIVFL